ncbi:hypothetical protein EON80_31310 [bacterium]|nr:MAG: hypothetical protein EON80_31310 [bacterium]
MFAENPRPHVDVTLIEVGGKPDLMEEWEQLDLRLRILKHRERVIAPLVYHAAIGNYDLPANDPLILALYGLCLETSGYACGLNRRGREVAAKTQAGS